MVTLNIDDRMQKDAIAFPADEPAADGPATCSVTINVRDKRCGNCANFDDASSTCHLYNPDERGHWPLVNPLTGWCTTGWVDAHPPAPPAKPTPPPVPKPLKAMAITMLVILVGGIIPKCSYDMGRLEGRMSSSGVSLGPGEAIETLTVCVPEGSTDGKTWVRVPDGKGAADYAYWRYNCGESSSAEIQIEPVKRAKPKPDCYVDPTWTQQQRINLGAEPRDIDAYREQLRRGCA